MTKTLTRGSHDGSTQDLPAHPDFADVSLRIALIAPPYYEVPPKAYGGVEAVVADLADGLVAMGHQVILVGAAQCHTQARLHPVWERTVPERLGDPFAEVLNTIRTRNAVQQLAAAGEVDIVHDHTTGGPLSAAVFSQLAIPSVVTAHGPVDSDLGLFYAELGTDVSIVAISHRQRALAPELNWISTVHHGVRPADWPFQRQKGEYALWLGRYHPHKGPHLALHAAHAAKLPLKLAGKCSELPEQRFFAEQVTPLLGPHDRVLGLADARRKRELLAHARCLVFPVQWEEPFGMVMIEAMVCGTPVVALRGGAVPEVIAHGITGFVCDHPGELPDAMHEAAKLDPAACREHVVQNFSAERMCAEYVRAYRRVLARQSGIGGHLRRNSELIQPLDGRPTLTTGW